MATKAQAYQARVANAKRFKTVPHRWEDMLVGLLHPGCGIVALRNDSTRKRMPQGCESMGD